MLRKFPQMNMSWRVYWLDMCIYKKKLYIFSFITYTLVTYLTNIVSSYRLQYSKYLVLVYISTTENHPVKSVSRSKILES